MKKQHTFSKSDSKLDEFRRVNQTSHEVQCNLIKSI